MSEPIESAEPVISLKCVNHSYPDKQVLFDITVDIQAGEIIIIRGQSGCGKTTLVTLAGALRSVQEGSLRVLGQELRGASPDVLLHVRENIGFIFQAHNLLGPLTATQNVRMALDLDLSISEEEKLVRSRAMLTEVGLGNKLDFYPKSLSGGQNQRVAVARALVRRPKIVLADEPTASLDSKSGREVADILRKLAKKQGCAILLVTHDDRILDIADKIMTIEDGRIASFETTLRKQVKNMLSVYSYHHRKGNLVQHVSGLSDDEFLKHLKKVSFEFEQLALVLDMGSRESVRDFSQQVLEALQLKIIGMLNADRASIFWVDTERKTLSTISVDVGAEEGKRAQRLEIPITTGIAGRVAAAGRMLNIPDAYNCPYFNPGPDRETGYKTRSVLSLPIFDNENKVCAVASVLNKKDGGAFTEADEIRFEDFAKQMSPILQAIIVIQKHA